MNIDELVVEFTLDGTGFKKGSAEAVKAQEDFKQKILAAQDQVARSMGMTKDQVGEVGKAFKSQQEQIKVTEAAERQLMGLTKEQFKIYKTEEAQKAQEIEKQNRAARNDAARTAKELEARGAQAGEFFGQIKDQALSLFAVLLGGKGLASFVATETSKIPGIGRGAVNIGIPAQDLEAYRDAVARRGGSADTAQSELEGMAAELQRQKTGRGSADVRGGLVQIGATGFENPLDVAKKFAAFAEANKNDQQFVNQIGGALNYSQGTINELSSGSFLKDIKESYRQGVDSKETIKNITDLQEALIGLQQTTEHIATAMLGDVAPRLTQFLGIIKEWEIAHPEQAKAVGWGIIAGGAAATAAVAKRAWNLLKGGAATAKGAVAEGATEIAEGAGEVAAGGMSLTRIASPVGAFLYMMRPYATQTQEMEDRGLAEARAAAAGNPPTSGNAPRGIRNNNPGNLEYRGQPGAVPEPGAGRFAAFPTMSQGIGALASQLERYQDRGINTIRGIISTYAPNTENDTPGYIGSVAKSLGLSADQAVNVRDPKIMRALIKAISKVENGPRWQISDEQINQARILQDNRADLKAITSGAPGFATANNNTSTSNTTSSVATHINGPITINTKSTDAKDIANEFQRMHENYTYTAQANSGLS